MFNDIPGGHFVNYLLINQLYQLLLIQLIKCVNVIYIQSHQLLILYLLEYNVIMDYFCKFKKKLNEITQFLQFGSS